VKPFRGRALLAMEQGTGKTPTALGVIAFFREWPVVVVCPSSMKYTWRAEAEAWLEGILSPEDIVVIQKGKDPTAGKLIILSYNLVTKRTIEIAVAFDPTMLVLDESTYIKNPDASRTNRLVPLCKHAKRCLLLSGTPVLNRPIDLLPQLDALGVIRKGDTNPNFRSVKAFKKRFCGPRRGRFGIEYKGASNLEELNRALVRTCMIRHRKEDVLPELPEKTRMRIILEEMPKSVTPEELIALCHAAIDAGGGDLEKARRKLHDKDVEVRGQFTRLYQACGMQKVKAAAEIVRDHASLEAPLVVFAHHKAVLDELSGTLRDAELPFMRIDGSTPPKQRQKFIEGFQGGDYAGALLSITAVSMGVTLTRSSNMLIAELPLGPAMAEQAEDRIHRVSQKNAALIRYLVARGTLDDVIWKILNRKSRVASQIVDGMDRSVFANVETETQGTYWSVVEALLRDVWEERYAAQLKLSLSARGT
jgi:SWI/SNF-related matrix-associated actin-dependent regulator 1 of chromatin subfamily A